MLQQSRYKASEEVDFVIIGSGAAGGVLAKELSTNGFRVVVLEQGPYLTEVGFTHNEIAVLKHHQLTNHPELQPTTFRKTPQEQAKRQPALVYGRMVGGSSVHFTANYWRFHEIDFVERRKVGPISGTGFADWPLIAYHFAQAHVVTAATVPILYAAAMAASGAGALALGRLFDARGFIALLPGILIAALAAPLAFLGGAIPAILGALCWGAAMGVENSVLTAGVAHLVPEHSRARAYGIFSAVFGIAWFAGSALLGALYDISIPLLVAISIAAELAALIPFVLATRVAKV